MILSFTVTNYVDSHYFGVVIDERTEGWETPNPSMTYKVEGTIQDCVSGLQFANWLETLAKELRQKIKPSR